MGSWVLVLLGVKDGFFVAVALGSGVSVFTWASVLTAVGGKLVLVAVG